MITSVQEWAGACQEYLRVQVYWNIGVYQVIRYYIPIMW